MRICLILLSLRRSVMSNSVTPWPVHVILQARILEWIIIPFSKGSSLPRDQTWEHCRQFLYHLSHQESHFMKYGSQIIMLYTLNLYSAECQLYLNKNIEVKLY